MVTRLEPVEADQDPAIAADQAAAEARDPDNYVVVTGTRIEEPLGPAVDDPTGILSGVRETVVPEGELAPLQAQLVAEKQARITALNAEGQAAAAKLQAAIQEFQRLQAAGQLTRERAAALAKEMRALISIISNVQEQLRLLGEVAQITGYGPEVAAAAAAAAERAATEASSAPAPAPTPVVVDRAPAPVSPGTDPGIRTQPRTRSRPGT